MTRHWSPALLLLALAALPPPVRASQSAALAVTATVVRPASVSAASRASEVRVAGGTLYLTEVEVRSEGTSKLRGPAPTIEPRGEHAGALRVRTAAGRTEVALFVPAGAPARSAHVLVTVQADAR